MELSQSDIALLHFSAWVLGAALGFFFDLLRLPRKLLLGDQSRGRQPTATPLRKRRAVGFAVFLEDFLFCQVAAVSMILLFYERNNGKVRPFSFLVTLAGYVLYRMTLGKLVNRLIEALLKAIRKVVRNVIRVVLKPCKAAWQVGKRWGRSILAARRERREKQARRITTKRLLNDLNVDGGGILPHGDRLNSLKQETDPTAERKIKQRKTNGRKKESAKDHRAEQESMA